tara:strand:+ start:1089 stop:2222 length:1134 start_codon:yes stop_codon:yes gene_type:complete
MPMKDLKLPTNQILLGNNTEVLAKIPDNSIDSIVTDPPYEIAFMAKKWDNVGAAYSAVLWAHCFRVLKPGGHIIAFGATRTVHRLACSIEDAGFEIRDTISWLYFSGFPKSLNISKGIDKHYGADREVDVDITAPATPEAKEWDGWGTGLKPSQEPAILARKPIAEKNICLQVLKTGTGAINIDGCRFAYGDPCWVGPQCKTGSRLTNTGSPFSKNSNDETAETFIENNLGRWPANIYQCKKPSRSERDQGLDHLAPTLGSDAVQRKPDSAGINNPRAGAGRTAETVKNFHPTVKPVDLMRWLVRLVTPPKGVVLDPFAGSGSTLVAATLEGIDSIGIEITPEYLPIITGRVKDAEYQYKLSRAQITFGDWMDGLYD